MKKKKTFSKCDLREEGGIEKASIEFIPKDCFLFVCFNRISIISMIYLMIFNFKRRQQNSNHYLLK